MLRTFCKVAFAIGLCGCVTFPKDYVVRLEQGQSTLYKPGTRFEGGANAPTEVWLKIPMLRVSDCKHDRIDYVASTARGEIRWHLTTTPLGETSARFSAASFEALSQLTRPASIISSARSSAGSGCILTLPPAETPMTVRESQDTPAYTRALLDILIAERLPTTAATSWVDQYDYDSETRSMNILPGMRIRIQSELPLTADSDNEVDPYHPGVLTAPTYLELSALGPNDPGKGQWSTSLEKLGFQKSGSSKKTEKAVDHEKKDERRFSAGSQSAVTDVRFAARRTWTSASGLPDLGTNARFWRLFVPSQLLPAVVTLPTQSCDEDCVAKQLESAIAPLRGQLAVGASDANPAQSDASDSAAPHGADQPKMAAGDRQMLSTGTPHVGETFPKEFEDYPGFTLAGSPRKAEIELLLDTVIANRDNGPNLTAACKRTSPGVACYVFRFRAVITPEIPIRVNGQTVWIEAGTTVFHLLQRSSAGQLQGHFSSPLAGTRNQAQNTSLVVNLMDQRRRQHWEATAHGLVLKRRFEGRLAPIKAPNASNTMLLDLVLQMGDEISWLR